MKRTSLLLAALLALVAVLTSTPAAADFPPGLQLYTVGDSITAGVQLLYPTRDGWPKRVADRICGMNCAASLHIPALPGRCLVYTGCGAAPLVDVWASTVLDATPTPTTILLEIGVNDLSHVTDAQMQAAYVDLVAQAQARGIRILVGTIVPTAAAWAYHAVTEDQRGRINAWLRSYFGETLDFDLILRTSAGTLDPAYDSGDHLHPNPYGHLRMADAVPLDRIA